MPQVTGSNLLARQLRDEGVEDLFYVMGGPIIEAAGEAADQGIRTVDCRHEQGAAMAAHGYARVKMKTGVCLAASGPASTNLLTGIANAFTDCVPLLALGGAAGYRAFDTDAFQEYDQLSMARPVTRYATRVTHADRMPEYINLCYRKTLAPKPGPVYLDLPGDTLYDGVEDEEARFIPTGHPPVRPAPDPHPVEQAIAMLKAAERPVVLTGSGIIWSQAWEELQEFVATAQIPFFTTPQGRGVIPEDNDLSFLGARGLAFREADVMLVVGTRFNYVISMGQPPRFAADAKLIQIDIDASEIGHNRHVDLGIVADAKVALQALTAEAKQAGLAAKQDWVAKLRENDSSKRAETAKLAESDATPIHPLRIANEIANYIDRDAILCVDGMETLNFSRQWISSYVPGARVNSGPNGCMGVGVPFMVGAQVAAPNRQVVGFVGDGSFFMNVQELDTMVRHNLPIVCLISNNGGWTGGSNETPGRTLGFHQKYQDIMVALGGHGELVTDPNEIRPAIERSFASKKPSLINVHVDEHARATTVAFSNYSSRMERRRY